MYSGTLSAIVTPFKTVSNGELEVDFDSLEHLIHWQIESGIDGLVVCGSTGEAATLSTEEKLAVIRRSMEIVAGRVPVIAGTGTNDTAASVALTGMAKGLKVDGVLAVTPYYNKPTQEGLVQHFSAIAAVGLPVVLYNIPGRSTIEIATSTLVRLTSVPNIVAVKQAVDSASKLVELADAIGDKISILAGDDPITYAVLSVGGKGVISASASVIPKEMLEITNAAKRGDLAESLLAQRRALPLIHALFLETNPIPAKAALKMMGIINSDALRLPLVPASENTRKVLAQYFS